VEIAETAEPTGN